MLLATCERKHSMFLLDISFPFGFCHTDDTFFLQGPSIVSPTSICQNQKLPFTPFHSARIPSSTHAHSTVPTFSRQYSTSVFAPGAFSNIAKAPTRGMPSADANLLSEDGGRRIRRGAGAGVVAGDAEGVLVFVFAVEAGEDRYNNVGKCEWARDVWGVGVGSIKMETLARFDTGFVDVSIDFVAIDASCSLQTARSALPFGCDMDWAFSESRVDGSLVFGIVDGALMAASDSRCRVMLFSPTIRYSPMGGGGGGASVILMSSSVLDGVFRFRFLPFEGGRWEARWRPRGCMRLWSHLANGCM
jgi:hypothetical protein